MKKFFIPLGLFAIAAIAGWTAGTPDRPATPPDIGRPATPNRAASGPRTIRDPEVAAAMERIRSATTEKERLQATVDLARGIPDEDIVQWLTGGRFKDKDRALERLFYQTLYNRYATVDPANCTVLLFKQPDFEFGFNNHLSRWAGTDHQAMLAFAETVVDGDLQSRMMGAALPELAKVNPRAALEKLTGNLNAQPRLRPTLEAVARVDPQLALDWCEDLTGNSYRQARDAVAAVRFEGDFRAALAWAREETDFRHLVAQGVRGKSLSPKEFTALVGELPPAAMAEAIKALSRSGHAEEWLAVDYRAMGVAPKEANELGRVLILEVAKDDGEKAIAASRALRADATETDFYMEFWLRQMSKAMANFGEEVENRWKEALGPTDQAFLRGTDLTTLWNDKGPMEPAEAIHKMADTREVPAKEFMFRWTEADADAAAAAIPEIPSKDVPNLRRLLDDQENRVPKAIKAAILTEAAKGKVPGVYYSQLVGLGYKWGLENPAAAAKWALELPAHEARDCTIISVATAWHSRDPGATAKWIESLPEPDQVIARKAYEPLPPAGTGSR